MLPILFTILLLEGFITISVEILTMRQLMPFYGSSVLITSVIIGFFLLFLALGYWRGGTYRQDFFRQLTRNYLLSMLWIGVGLSYLFIAFFSHVTLTSLSLTYLVSLTLYLVLVLAPIVYWLGQTIPITTNLFSYSQTVSKISGSALFLSTLGSFMGAIVTSLLLFQFLGVAFTVVTNCVLLVILVACFRSKYPLPWWIWMILVLSLWMIKILNMDTEGLLFQRTNNYANYQLKTIDREKRLLKINESPSSLIDKERQGFPYITFIRHILFEELAIKNNQLLIIGAGGFSLTAAGTNDNQITYLDIDPDIKKIAEKYFLEASVKGTFIGQDARRFLNQSQALYDVIISDAYSNDMSIPASLLTIEYFQQLARHLKPSGLLLVNIIADPLFRDDYSRRVDNTIRKVFTHCAIVPLAFNIPLSNIIYICPAVLADKVLYTDNLNRATIDYFSSRQNAGN